MAAQESKTAKVCAYPTRASIWRHKEDSRSRSIDQLQVLHQSVCTVSHLPLLLLDQHKASQSDQDMKPETARREKRAVVMWVQSSGTDTQHLREAARCCTGSRGALEVNAPTPTPTLTSVPTTQTVACLWVCAGCEKAATRQTAAVVELAAPAVDRVHVVLSVCVDGSAVRGFRRPLLHTGSPKPVNPAASIIMTPATVGANPLFCALWVGCAGSECSQSQEGSLRRTFLLGRFGRRPIPASGLSTHPLSRSYQKTFRQA